MGGILLIKMGWQRQSHFAHLIEIDRRRAAESQQAMEVLVLLSQELGELLHCSKMLALDAAMDTGADRFAWAAHYLGEMAKAVVDDLANGMLPNGGEAAAG